MKLFIGFFPAIQTKDMLQSALMETASRGLVAMQKVEGKAGGKGGKGEGKEEGRREEDFTRCLCLCGSKKSKC